MSANLFVIAAPSGAGKTTLVKELVRRNPQRLEFSVSYTTRPQRASEVDGRDYFFVSEKEFTELRRTGELLESALVFDNHYGTSRSQVEARLEQGQSVILEIDWQGARQVRRARPDCLSIFILPPSRSELSKRLRGRSTDSEDVIAKRLGLALSDMSHWGEFDYCIVNDDLDTAVAELEAIVDGKGGDNRIDNPRLRARIAGILGGAQSAAK